jgi:fibronectin type 3 domain-containing protein
MRKVWWYVLLGAFVLVPTVTLLVRDAEVKPHRVALTWQPPAARSGVTLAGYNVYRRTVESRSFVMIAEKVRGQSYEDRLVTSGRKYVYVVTSVDTEGRESMCSMDTTAEIP